MAATPQAQPQNSLIPSFLSDIRVLQIIGQIVFVIIILVIFSQLAATASTELHAKGLAPGFSFLNLRAGFDIGEKPAWYTADNSYGDAFIVGMTNTLRIVTVGLVATTVLGILVGIVWWLCKTAGLLKRSRAIICIIAIIPSAMV